MAPHAMSSPRPSLLSQPFLGGIAGATPTLVACLLPSAVASASALGGMPLRPPHSLIQPPCVAAGQEPTLWHRKQGATGVAGLCRRWGSGPQPCRLLQQRTRVGRAAPGACFANSSWTSSKNSSSSISISGCSIRRGGRRSNRRNRKPTQAVADCVDSNFFSVQKSLINHQPADADGHSAIGSRSRTASATGDSQLNSSSSSAALLASPSPKSFSPSPPTSVLTVVLVHYALWVCDTWLVRHVAATGAATTATMRAAAAGAQTLPSFSCLPALPVTLPCLSFLPHLSLCAVLPRFTMALPAWVPASAVRASVLGALSVAPSAVDTAAGVLFVALPSVLAGLLDRLKRKVPWGPGLGQAGDSSSDGGSGDGDGRRGGEGEGEIRALEEKQEKGMAVAADVVVSGTAAAERIVSVGTPSPQVDRELDIASNGQEEEAAVMVADDLDPTMEWGQRAEDAEAEVQWGADLAPFGFSFSAAGLLFPYHLGATQCLVDNDILTDETPLAGASAGAIVCATIAAGVPTRQALQLTKVLSNDCRENGTAFRLGAVLRDILEQILPQDAHIKCSGRIRVAVTQVFRQPRAWLVDQFDSRQDLIDALITSSFIPGYLAPTPVTRFRNRICIDGGLSQFVPPSASHDTIRICTFPASGMGLPDIAISPDLNPTNQWSMKQLLQWALEPAEDEILDLLYEEGYRDTARWVEATLADASSPVTLAISRGVKREFDTAVFGQLPQLQQEENEELQTPQQPRTAAAAASLEPSV